MLRRSLGQLSSSLPKKIVSFISSIYFFRIRLICTGCCRRFVAFRFSSNLISLTQSLPLSLRQVRNLREVFLN